MKTIDEPMPICEAEMERLEDQLVEDCKSLGMAESIRDFLQGPFSEWMDELADESSGGDDSSTGQTRCGSTCHRHAADHGGA